MPFDNPDELSTGGSMLPMAGTAAPECAVGERCAEQAPDPAGCGSLTLDTSAEQIQVPGNLLVIFDRSTSMNELWEGRPKSEVAGVALQTALMPLQELLSVGAILFPSPDGGSGGFLGGLFNFGGSCSVNPITEADQFAFAAAPQFLAAFPSLWALASGSTPLGDAFEQANDVLVNQAPSFVGETAVVVLTDGEPNCSTNMTRVNTLAAQWLALGYPTHVIGLPGAGPASGVLQQLAVSGGTDTFLLPSDPAALQMRLEEIVVNQIKQGLDSCAINIDPPAENPDELHLVVIENGLEQEVDRDLGAGAGWTVTADGAQVSLLGALCDEATTGRFENIRFEFGCVDLPPLPPIIPQ